MNKSTEDYLVKKYKIFNDSYIYGIESFKNHYILGSFEYGIKILDKNNIIKPIKEIKVKDVFDLVINNNVLIVGCGNGKIIFYDLLKNNKILKEIDISKNINHNHNICSLSIYKNYLIIGLNYQIIFYDINKLKFIKKLDYQNYVSQLKIYNNLLITSSIELNSIRIFDLDNQFKLIKTINHSYNIRGLNIFENNIIILDDNKSIHFINIIKNYNFNNFSISFKNKNDPYRLYIDKNYLITSFNDGCIYLYDISILKDKNYNNFHEELSFKDDNYIERKINEKIYKSEEKLIKIFQKENNLLKEKIYFLEKTINGIYNKENKLNNKINNFENELNTIKNFNLSWDNKKILNLIKNYKINKENIKHDILEKVEENIIMINKKFENNIILNINKSIEKNISQKLNLINSKIEINYKHIENWNLTSNCYDKNNKLNNISNNKINSINFNYN